MDMHEHAQDCAQVNSTSAKDYSTYRTVTRLMMCRLVNWVITESKKFQISQLIHQISRVMDSLVD